MSKIMYLEDITEYQLLIPSENIKNIAAIIYNSYREKILTQKYNPAATGQKKIS